jgi:hypothetical protein
VVARRERRPAAGESSEGLQSPKSERSKVGDSELLYGRLFQCLCSWEKGSARELASAV